MIVIRPEHLGDNDQVRTINELAFESTAEAGIVDALRANCPDVLSLIDADDGVVVGHTLFSPVVIETAPAESCRGHGAGAHGCASGPSEPGDRFTVRKARPRHAASILSRTLEPTPFATQC